MFPAFESGEKKSFPSKILLLGEYGILTGSAAIATPFPLFSGELCLPPKFENFKETEFVKRSNAQLRALYNFLILSDIPIDFLNLDKLKNDIDSGLWFNSDIPQNYGIGSSGALTAALFNRYAPDKIKKLPLREIQTKMASVENYFHKTSSGIDPLVSLINKPLHFSSSGEISLIQQNIIPAFTKNKNGKEPGFSIFLVDSKTPIRTGGLVEWYLKEYQNRDFKHAADTVYIPAINSAVRALLSCNYSALLSGIATVSHFQKQFLTLLILPEFRKHVSHGLTTGDFYLKLCGSGGGGYMLGFTQNTNRVKEYFSQNQLEILFLE